MIKDTIAPAGTEYDDHDSITSTSLEIQLLVLYTKGYGDIRGSFTAFAKESHHRDSHMHVQKPLSSSYTHQQTLTMDKGNVTIRYYRHI